jgi:hypothetical protein
MATTSYLSKRQMDGKGKKNQGSAEGGGTIPWPRSPTRAATHRSPTTREFYGLVTEVSRSPRVWQPHRQSWPRQLWTAAAAAALAAESQLCTESKLPAESLHETPVSGRTHARRAVVGRTKAGGCIGGWDYQVHGWMDRGMGNCMSTCRREWLRMVRHCASKCACVRVS